MAGRCSIQRGAAAAQSPAPAPRSESGIYNVPVEGWHWQLRAAPSSRMWSPLSCTLRARLPSLAACVRVRLIFAACPRPRQAAAKLMSLSDSAKRAPPRGLEKEAHRMHAASTQPARQSARGQHAASTRRHAEQRGPLAGVYSCGPVCAAHTPRGERPLVLHAPSFSPGAAQPPPSALRFYPACTLRACTFRRFPPLSPQWPPRTRRSSGRAGSLHSWLSSPTGAQTRSRTRPEPSPTAGEAGRALRYTDSLL